MLLWEQQAHASNVMAQANETYMDADLMNTSQQPAPPTVQKQCPKCGEVRVIQFSDAVFSQNITCESCKEPSQLAFMTPQSVQYQNTKEDNDLAAAFARSFSLEHHPQLWTPNPSPFSQPANSVFAAPAPQPPQPNSNAFADRGDGSRVHYLAGNPTAYPPQSKPQPIVYASVHYTHSAHLQSRDGKWDAGGGGAEPYMREGYQSGLDVHAASGDGDVEMGS